MQEKEENKRHAVMRMRDVSSFSPDVFEAEVRALPKTRRERLYLRSNDVLRGYVHRQPSALDNQLRDGCGLTMALDDLSVQPCEVFRPIRWRPSNHNHIKKVRLFNRGQVR